MARSSMLLTVLISLSYYVLTTRAALEACATILVEQLGCRVSIATLTYVETALQIQGTPEDWKDENFHGVP